MEENKNEYSKLEHLKLIAKVIERMSEYSKSLKQFTSAIVVGLFLLIRVDNNIDCLTKLLFIIPIFIMGFLDGYYLLIEKRTRNFYNYVNDGNEGDYKISIKLKDGDIMHVIKSKSVWLYYLSLILFILLSLFI